MPLRLGRFATLSQLWFFKAFKLTGCPISHNILLSNIKKWSGNNIIRIVQFIDVIIAALRSICGHYIFALWFFMDGLCNRTGHIYTVNHKNVTVYLW